MPSTVYKGDLVEASFGHESGISLTDSYSGSFHFIAKEDEDWPNIDTSIITFSGGYTGTPVNNGLLAYPEGMLVGSQLTFTGITSGFNTADNGKLYTIVKNERVGSLTEITVSPALKTDHSDGNITSANGTLEILPFKTPTMDVSSIPTVAAHTSAERVLTDQFIGIVNTITLPETKVDLKRFHVVGLGRDVAVQTPGRFLNQGGSFEANLHNARWLYYCLGQEAVQIPNAWNGGGTFTLSGDHEIGTSYLIFAASNNTDPTNLAVGDYIVIADTATVDVNVHMGAVSGGTWPSDGHNNIVINKAVKTEVRRIAGYDKAATNSWKVWLDDPLQYDHDNSTPIKFIRCLGGATNGEPDLDVTTKVITNPVSRLLYSKDTVPSFAMEVSIRRNEGDTASGASASDEIVDGGATDSKQLTRVFRGCKVKDWSMTADTDAALRLTTNFDAALCYTDTGRLESSTPGDRYDTHRLLDEVPTLANRKNIGLAKGTQKPFMFYNGTIKVKGVTLGQVVSFTLNGKTGVEQHYTINGVTTGDSATDQVPFAGTRNASISIEGKTEYDLEMEIIVDDPIFYHNMRRTIRNFDEDTTNNLDDDMIRLSFTKQGGSGVRESMDIIIDDYFITEAPLPIPEDKGPIKSTLKIMPKSVKVVAKDTLLHA